jgi:GT2 family glycosyltransferase
MLVPDHSQRKTVEQNRTRIAVVIATYGRPNSLTKVLEGLRAQTLAPDRIVIVDATPNAILQKPPYLQSIDGLKIDYLVSRIGSLPAQKNLGIDFLMKNWAGDFIQILDDDTKPREDFIEHLADFLNRNPGFVGASGLCMSDDDEYATSVWVEKTGWEKVKQNCFRVFGLDSRRPGIVTRGGVGTFTDPNIEVTETQWLHGTSMWRFALFSDQMYDPSLLGSALCEDLDFSIRALRKGKLATISAARIEHEMSPENRPDWPLHYYRFSRNRLLLFKSENPLTLRVGNYVVANIAISLSLLAKYMLHPWDRSMVRAFFNVYKGMFDGFQNKPPK